MADSVYSTSYVINDEEQRHVYYKPLAPGGIFSSTYVRDTMECSNGAIYNLYDWPFAPEQIYFYPVKTEGENVSLIREYSLCTYSVRSVVADSVSDNYLVISPQDYSSQWRMTFQIPEVLSGRYDVCAVVLPRTVYDPNNKNWYPCKFKATLNYVNEDGTNGSYPFDEVQNDPYRVDTVKLGTFTIPVCSYGQTNPVVSLRLECSIPLNQFRFNREMYLDCLYFKPNREEEE